MIIILFFYVYGEYLLQKVDKYLHKGVDYLLFLLLLFYFYIIVVYDYPKGYTLVILKQIKED